MSLNDDSKIVPFGRPNGRKALPPLEFPDITPTGIIRPTCANARIAIGLLGVTCEYDEFHDKLLIGGQPIGQHAGELSDHACVYLREMIDQRFGFDPGRHPHMLRHSCGYKLANDGVDTRTIQAYLGHKSIQHTVRYTELAPTRFRHLFRD
jgi:integrase